MQQTCSRPAVPASDSLLQATDQASANRRSSLSSLPLENLSYFGQGISKRDPEEEKSGALNFVFGLAELDTSSEGIRLGRGFLSAEISSDSFISHICFY